MNYLNQLLAFRDYQTFQTKLSSGQIALWLALMQINNKTAWTEWFTAANSTLETLSGLSRQGINKSRNTLKQLGLIDFKSNGKKATSYHVCKLYTSNSVQDSLHKSVQESVQDSLHKSSTLNKHKLETETQTNSFDDDDDELVIKTRARETIQNLWKKNIGELNDVQANKLNIYTDKYQEQFMVWSITRLAESMPVDTPMAYLETIISNRLREERANEQ